MSSQPLLSLENLSAHYVSQQGARVVRAVDDVTLSLNAAVAGRFKVVVDRIMPLSQAVQAHELIESRTGIGKIILDPTKI